MSKLFPGSIPYGLDRERLSAAFPVAELTEGRAISHEALEGALGIPRGTTRYYGVIDSWMRRTRNVTGIYMVWVPGNGVTVLNPAALLGHAETRTRQKIRQTKRAVGIFGWVQQRRDRLDDTGKARLDHQMRIANALRLAAEETSKQMAIELAPVLSLPKRKVG